MIKANFTFRQGDDPMPAIRRAQIEGLELGGELVLDASNRLVPLEEGTLERSGRVTSNGKDTVAISYDTPYAVRQHEDMTLRHPNGRQAKFLEVAMHKSRAKVLAIVARKIKGVM